MENRNGLAVDVLVKPATGTAERDAAFVMAAQIPGDGRVTIGGDKNYDTAGLIDDWRGLNVTPHVAQNDSHRRSAIDQRTRRHPGYQISQRKRKRVEEIFGWLKTVGGLRKLHHRGPRKPSSDSEPENAGYRRWAREITHPTRQRAEAGATGQAWQDTTNSISSCPRLA